MLKDVLGSIFSFIMIIIMLVITPIYYVGIIQWARSEAVVNIETRNLIDEVIDTRFLIDDTLKDYNLSIAALPMNYVITISRKVKVINPDPLNPGSTYTTYVVVDDISKYEQGDFIVVNLEPVGNNLFQIISKSLMGLSIPSNSFTLAGRVR